MSTSLTKLSNILSRREVLATLTVVPVVYFYWSDLLDSLDGNRAVASLIVIGAWFGNLNLLQFVRESNN